MLGALQEINIEIDFQKEHSKGTCSKKPILNYIFQILDWQAYTKF